MTHHCGNYSNYQFGRTYTCEEGDWQCPSCQLLDAEDRISQLESELEALAEKTREECAKVVEQDLWPVVTTEYQVQYNDGIRRLAEKIRRGT